MRPVIIGIWNEFEDHRWNHLIETMSERIQAVIKAKLVPHIFSIRLDRITYILDSHKV